MTPTYLAIYKPYMVLCQFTPEQIGDITLADLNLQLPNNCYPIGRLDKDSEGLLLISNDNVLKTKFLDPKNKHQKTYLAQVEGIPNDESLLPLRKGVHISVNGKKHLTLPAIVHIITTPPTLPERNPPIRYRANIPTTWVSISITEGKNRQIRKMFAAVGFPVLRLVRVGLEQLNLSHLDDNRPTFFNKNEIYSNLNMR